MIIGGSLCGLIFWLAVFYLFYKFITNTTAKVD